MGSRRRSMSHNRFGLPCFTKSSLANKFSLFLLIGCLCFIHGILCPALRYTGLFLLHSHRCDRICADIECASAEPEWPSARWKGVYMYHPVPSCVNKRATFGGDHVSNERRKKKYNSC